VVASRSSTGIGAVADAFSQYHHSGHHQQRYHHHQLSSSFSHASAAAGHASSSLSPQLSSFSSVHVNYLIILPPCLLHIRSLSRAHFPSCSFVSSSFSVCFGLLCARVFFLAFLSLLSRNLVWFASNSVFSPSAVAFLFSFLFLLAVCRVASVFFF
jgi:hypothetical protein